MGRVPIAARSSVVDVRTFQQMIIIHDDGDGVNDQDDVVDGDNDKDADHDDDDGC